jgi:hypothetical protein
LRVTGYDHHGQIPRGRPRSNLAICLNPFAFDSSLAEERLDIACAVVNIKHYPCNRD